jgi:hypothetical protein
MAAGVSLDRAIALCGRTERRGTYTPDLVKALRALGLECADRCRVVKRTIPVLPARAIVAIHPQTDKKRTRGHWMLTWDGRMYDPAGRWPDFGGWRITSYLEIKS